MPRGNTRRQSNSRPTISLALLCIVWHREGMTDEISHEELPADANEPATKADVYAVKRGLQTLKSELTTYIDTKHQETLDHFDTAVENITEQLKGANTDEVSLLKDADNTLHRRIMPLEERAGLPSPEHEPHPFGQA